MYENGPRSHVMYSDYRGRNTMKFFAACCPIGCTHAGSLSRAGTEAFKVLESIPFGLAVQVDKDVLIDNLCAFLGIACILASRKS
jgi:hypothetical protein